MLAPIPGYISNYVLGARYRSSKAPGRSLTLEEGYRRTCAARDGGAAPDSAEYAASGRRFLQSSEQAHHVCRIDAAQGPVAVARREHLAVLVEDEFRRLNDAAPVLPPGAELVGDRARHAVGYRKRHFFLHDSGFVDGFDAGRDYACTDRLDVILEFRETDQLPAAIGSPVAAVEQNHPVLAVHFPGNVEGSSVDELQRYIGKLRADAEFFRGHVYS